MVISSKLADSIGGIAVHYGLISLLKSHYRPLNSEYWCEEPKTPFFLLEVFSLFDSPFFGRGTGWCTPTVSEPHMKYLNEYPGRFAGDIHIITFFAQNDTYSFSARIRIGERNELLQRSQSYFRLSIEWGHETRKLS